jgi:hypothetical protein
MAEKRRPLTPKEIKLVKATAEGKNQTEAGLIADDNRTPESARVWANQTLQKPTVQEMLAKAFADNGITIEAATKPIADGLKATRTVIVRDKAASAEESDNSAFADEVPDHAIRLKAAGMAFNLMGVGKQTGDVTINFIGHSSEKREVYDL